MNRSWWPPCRHAKSGGVNTGRTWEFVNFATLHRLPLVVVCENNLYAVETNIDNTTSGAIVERAAVARVVAGRERLDQHRRH